MCRDHGIKGELFFEQLLMTAGLVYEPTDRNGDDSWFDFLIKKKYKVEVKSCQVSVKFVARGKKVFRCGRFDFTDEDNRKLQYENDIWVALVLRHEDDCIFLGFVKARELNKKRYLPLSQIRQHNLVSFNDWLFKIGDGGE